MPPPRKVKPLYSLCFLIINNSINDCVKFLYYKYGSYKSLHCQKNVKDLQDYLLNYLHPKLLDDILHNFELRSNATGYEKFLILSVFMHSGMRYMLPKFHLPPGDNFYVTYLKQLNNLVSLNLSMVCTDEILQIIGEFCPKLESIHIVSKVNGTSSKHARVRLNALRLNLFISDQGLESLHKCKNLKRIFMNRRLRSNCGGRKTSHYGIGKLLMNLSKLEYVNYQDMGLVIESLESVDSLKLVQLQDYHATPDHILLFSKLCPNLSSLALCVSPSDCGLSQQCLDKLANSPLNLTSLDMIFFSFGNSMKNYLIEKGQFLTSLTINNGYNLNLDSLIFIGRFCPNIKSLQVHFLQKEECVIDAVNKDNYFTQLEVFHLAGAAWSPISVFSLCLSNAKGLQVIKLLNKSYKKPVDNDILFLLAQNPLLELKEASFCEGLTMSFRTLNSFILSCKNLSCLSLKDCEGAKEFIEQFNLLHTFDLQIQLT